MFVAPGAGESLGNLSFVILAAIVAQFCELIRVPFTGDNGPDDELAGFVGNIADGLGKLDIHPQHGLLHMLDMRGAMLDELRAMTQERTQVD